MLHHNYFIRSLQICKPVVERLVTAHPDPNIFWYSYANLIVALNFRQVVRETHSSRSLKSRGGQSETNRCKSARQGPVKQHCGVNHTSSQSSVVAESRGLHVNHRMTKVDFCRVTIQEFGHIQLKRPLEPNVMLLSDKQHLLVLYIKSCKLMNISGLKIIPITCFKCRKVVG